MYAWQMAEDCGNGGSLLLVDQYEREQGSSWGWKSKLAGRLGVDASTVNKMTTGARAVSKDVVTAAITRFPIDPSFFYDEALGDAPDYHDFVGTRVERDDDRGTPNAEAYLAGLDAIGKPASPEHAKRLQGIRLSTGDMPVSAFGPRTGAGSPRRRASSSSGAASRCRRRSTRRAGSGSSRGLVKKRR